MTLNSKISAEDGCASNSNSGADEGYLLSQRLMDLPLNRRNGSAEGNLLPGIETLHFLPVRQAGVQGDSLANFSDVSN